MTFKLLLEFSLGVSRRVCYDGTIFYCFNLDIQTNNGFRFANRLYRYSLRVTRIWRYTIIDIGQLFEQIELIEIQ